MTNPVFINLPVKDLSASTEFFKQIGYAVNERFTDENACCIIISDTVYVMLLSEPQFKSFTGNDICDTVKFNEVITAISVNSRKEVDDLANRAFDAGAGKAGETQDHGWLYQRSFSDLDGHRWEILFADPSEDESPEDEG